MLLENLLFAKYQSSGNDFVIIEDLKKEFPAHDLPLIRRLCHPKFGVGADGLVLLQKYGKDFAMRFFNPDATEAAQCGNALLCLGHFIRDLGNHQLAYIGKQQIRFHENKVVASLGIPITLFWDLPIENERCYVIDTGVPHAVILNTPSDFLQNSRAIRYSAQFPKGINVNWVEVVQNNRAIVRTYERGVEGETFSCGTGAAASAFVLSKLFGWEGKVEMIFPSEEKIDVYIGSDIEIAGEPKCVFKGHFLL